MEKMKKKEKVMHRFFVLLLAVMTVSVFGAVPVRAEDNSQQYETEVLAQTNRERISVGLPPLTTFGLIEQSADVRAREIAEYFSHERPDGTDCFTAIEVLWPNTAGENIARAYPTPLSVVDGWMNSPGHRANILNEEFTHLSVGYYEASSRNWVQMFLGTCKFDAMSLSTNEVTVNQGTSLAAQNISVYMHCAKHGTSTMPLTDEMVIGFNSQVTGSQQVTVRYSDSLTAALTVNVRHEHTWSCAHDGSSHWLVCDCGEVKDTAKHDWSRKDGTCTVCGYKCGSHDWSKRNGVCGICGYRCASHDWSKKDGVCGSCGYRCASHDWSKKNGVCGICGYKCESHDWSKKDGACGICGYRCASHDWSRKNGVCGICGYKCGSHDWSKKNGVCGICGYRCGSHDWSKKNGACAICGLGCTHGGVKTGTCKTCGAFLGAADISRGALTLSQKSWTYTGKAVRPGVTVKYGSTTLKANTDYTVQYSGNTNPGTARVTVLGKGNYKGTLTANFTISVSVGKVSLGSVRADSSAKVTLSWNAVSGATGYRVFRKTGSSGWKILKTVNAGTKQCADTAVRAGTKYTYTVRAYRTVNGKIYWGDYDRTGLSVTPPMVGTVKLGSIKASSSTKVTLSWNTVSGATGYRIYRRTGSGSWKTLKTVTAKTRQYTDTTVKAGTQYSYTVRAYRKLSGKTYWGSYDRKGLTVTTPKAAYVKVGTVKLGSIKANSAKKVTLSWNAVSGATGYRIYRRTGNGSWTALKTVNAKIRRFTDTTAKAGTKYTYTVRAYRRVNGRVYWGSYNKKGLTVTTPKK